MNHFTDTANELIMHNKEAHDIVAPHYDSRHIEIFNPTEQNRIKNVLLQSIMQIQTGCGKPMVLDFGAGTGNLTKHLLDMKVDVTASDVSAGCLEQLTRKLECKGKIKTDLLNGVDLSNYRDNSFDMVATYSVLHHIPDYLKIITEFIRVTKPGGIIYIDHEVCPSYWEFDAIYQRYLKELGGHFSLQHLVELEIIDKSQMKKKLRQKEMLQKLNPLLLAAIFWGKIIRRINSTSDESKKEQAVETDEGDIHVRKNDHIEWDRIESILQKQSEVIVISDYLVCREPDADPPVWNRWNGKCVDIRMLVARNN